MTKWANIILRQLRAKRFEAATHIRFARTLRTDRLMPQGDSKPFDSNDLPKIENGLRLSRHVAVSYS